MLTVRFSTEPMVTCTGFGPAHIGMKTLRVNHFTNTRYKKDGEELWMMVHLLLRVSVIGRLYSPIELRERSPNFLQVAYCAQVF